jgi:putative RNA 2'-phosphotransferase
MDLAHLKQLSKRMSHLLRHAPEQAGLALDPEGFVPLADLVAVLARSDHGVTAESVRDVVSVIAPEKQRFTIVDQDIRANYGHSIDTRIVHTRATPPDTLYHGTSVTALESIRANGLKPMGRQYVHLTPYAQLALSVGGRHGKPCLLKVSAREAHLAGVAFFNANPSFWLVTQLSPQYLTQVPS